MRITAKGTDGEFIFDIEKADFRKLQQIFAVGIGGQLRQDPDGSVLLRLPNTIDKDKRDTLSRFLLHPEELEGLSAEDVKVIGKFIDQVEANLLTVLDNLDLDNSKYLEIWNNFGSFVRNSTKTSTSWEFE